MTHSILSQLNLPGMKLLPMVELEMWEPRLLNAKTDRNRVEYYWTCSPTLIAYVLEKQSSYDVVSYLDADLYFFASPQPVFDEMGSESILIHGHRYAPAYKEKEATSGIYNVGMTCFRNDPNGWAVLRWWQNACLKACFYRPEKGYCGDQKYLDNWPESFVGVHVLKHKGAGLAPWNLDNYKLTRNHDCSLVDGLPVVFFHFHALQLVTPHLIIQIGFNISPMARKGLYVTYLKALQFAFRQVNQVSPAFNKGYRLPDWKNVIFSILYRRWVIA